MITRSAVDRTVPDRPAQVIPRREEDAGSSASVLTGETALKCVYMAIMSLDPTGRGRARWTSRWKTALNAFDITFDGHLSAVRQ